MTPDPSVPDETHYRLALPPGFDLEGYRIEQVLGKGGFGITYRAVDLELDAPVAIKEMLPDGIATRVGGLTVVAQTQALTKDFDWAVDRFINEARTLARLNHPNIVRVQRLLRAHGTAYIVMELVEGRSFHEWMKQQPGRPTEQELRDILLPLLDGLEYIHSHGLLHRDIKPENIFLTPEGRPVLLDFGSARADMSRTQTMTSMVSDGYAPFEQYQMRSRQGPASDLYALAAVMAHALTGQKPPGAPDRVMGDDAFPPLAVQCRGRCGENFLRTIDAALAVKMTDRPQTVAEFRQTLASGKSRPTVVSSGSPLTLPATSTAVVPWKWLGIGAGALTMIAAGAVSLWFVLKPGAPKQVPEIAQQAVAKFSAPASQPAGTVTTALAMTPVPDPPAPKKIPVAVPKPSVSPLLRQAEAAYLKADYPGAVALLDDLLATTTHDAKALSLRGLSRWLAAPWDEGAISLAELDFRAALSRDAEFSHAIKGLAWLLASTKRTEAAQSVLSKLKSPSNVEPDFGLALALVADKGTGREGAAAHVIESLDKAIRLHPGSAHLLRLRGHAHLLAKDDAAAITDLDEAIEANADVAQAWLLRGRAHKRNIDIEAEDDFDKAIELAPRYASAYMGRGMLHKSDDEDADALADFIKVTEIKPDHAKAWFLRARLSEPLTLSSIVTSADAKAKAQAAVAAYEKAVELDAANGTAWFHLGLLQQHLGKPALAIVALGNAADLGEHEDKARWMRGKLLRGEARNDEALEDFDAYIKLEPTEPKGHHARGKILEKLRRYPEAIASLLEARDLDDKGLLDESSWLGSYTYGAGYTAPQRGSSVKFSLTIASLDNSTGDFTGELSEGYSGFGSKGNDGLLHANVKGMVEETSRGLDIEFTKTYRYFQQDSVTYTGTYDLSTHSITGTWKFANGQAGTFVIEDVDL